jgi:hypothetical protein
MGGEGRVEYLVRTEMHEKILEGKPEEKVNWAKLVVNGRTELKWILKK